MKIYNLGSMNIDYVYQVDHFLRPGETLSSASMSVFPGGKGLNQSIAVARAGAQVIHGAPIGSDGGFLVKTMTDSGVDTSRIQTLQSPSGHAIIQVDPSGQNCILLFAGTNHLFTREYIDEVLRDAASGDILLLQNEINALDTIFSIATEKGLQIALNPSPFHPSLLSLPLDQVKWWFCNEIEAEALFHSSIPDEIIHNFRRMYPDSNLILTLGKHGSIFCNLDSEFHQPIYPVKTVDTTAAGDTFTDYFLSRIIQGDSVSSALDTASKAAAITVSRPGASVSIPLSAELESLQK